jgi:hypothetical protein
VRSAQRLDRRPPMVVATRMHRRPRTSHPLVRLRRHHPAVRSPASASPTSTARTRCRPAAVNVRAIDRASIGTGGNATVSNRRHRGVGGVARLARRHSHRECPSNGYKQPLTAPVSGPTWTLRLVRWRAHLLTGRQRLSPGNNYTVGTTCWRVVLFSSFVRIIGEIQHEE